MASAGPRPGRPPEPPRAPPPPPARTPSPWLVLTGCRVEGCPLGTSDSTHPGGRRGTGGRTGAARSSPRLRHLDHHHLLHPALADQDPDPLLPVEPVVDAGGGDLARLVLGPEQVLDLLGGHPDLQLPGRLRPDRLSLERDRRGRRADQ